MRYVPPLGLVAACHHVAALLRSSGLKGAELLDAVPSSDEHRPGAVYRQILPVSRLHPRPDIPVERPEWRPLLRGRPIGAEEFAERDRVWGAFGALDDLLHAAMYAWDGKPAAARERIGVVRRRETLEPDTVRLAFYGEGLDGPAANAVAVEKGRQPMTRSETDLVIGRCRAFGPEDHRPR